MKKKLGEILVATGVVSAADIDAALGDQSAGEPSRLGDLLVASGKLTSAELARALSEQYELPYVDLPPLPQAVLDLVPLELQRQFRFVPLKSEGTELSIAMADLTNVEVLAILEQQWTKVHVSVAGGDEIDALHNTLSGIFAAPTELPSVAPSISPLGPTADELFGSLDFETDGAFSPTPSPVPMVAPVTTEAPRAVSGPPKVEDLFGDLNLESVRTGIEAKPPEEEEAVVTEYTETPDELEPVGPTVELEAPLLPEGSGPVLDASIAEASGRVHVAETSGVVLEASVAEASGRVHVAETSGVVLEASIAEASGPVLMPEQSGPIIVAPAPMSEGSGVIVGLREGTGPLLDMLAESGGTGPVVDTPFFRDASVGDLVPPMADVPFSSPSGISLSALALAPPEALEPPPASNSAPPVPSSSPSGEVLPDWLRGDPAAAPPVAAPPPTDSAWTGALDHLAPSKLVVGLTRALLARGLVTEAEILAALGKKK